MATAHKWEMSPELWSLVDTMRRETEALRSTLSDLYETIDTEVTEHNDTWDERSERWQDGDKGQSVSAWIQDWISYRDDVETAMGNLDDILTTPEETPEPV